VIVQIPKIHQIATRDVMQQYVHMIVIVAIIHGIGYALILLYKNVLLLKKYHLMNHVVIAQNHRIHQIVMSNVMQLFVHMIHIVVIIHGIGFALTLLFMNVMQPEVMRNLKNHQQLLMQLNVVIVPPPKIHQIVMKDVMQQSAHMTLIVVIIHGIGFVLIQLFKNVLLQTKKMKHQLMNHVVIAQNQRIHQTVMNNVIQPYVPMTHTAAIIHGIGFVQTQLFRNAMHHKMKKRKIFIHHQDQDQQHVVNVLKHQIQQIVMKNVIQQYVHMILIAVIINGIGFVLIQQRQNVKRLEIFMKEKKQIQNKEVMKHVVNVQKLNQHQDVHQIHHVIPLYVQ